MKAVRLVGPGAVEIADVPEPGVDDEVVVRIKQVGICGTDTEIFTGSVGIAYPLIMGHEMAGEVVSAPAGSFYGVGTRILVDPAVSCGWCDLCAAGRPNLCRNGGLLGRDMDGVFTEYITAPTNRLVSIPPNVSEKASGLLQVLGTCVHAVKRLHPFPGQVAAVVGLGVSGQILAQLLRLKGMDVIGITRSEWKRDLALELGAIAVADPSEAAEVVLGHTDGRGADLGVEAAGYEATLADAISLTGIGGEILSYGTLVGTGKGLPYYDLYFKELTIHHPRAALISDYASGIALTAAGSISLEPIVTHQLDLSEAARAFELVQDSSSLKVLMKV